MGRKPNPLILEYFTRGPKLEDASNRYQHTCKSCGECFPKGRIDSLIAHLTKKCQSLSLQERRKIALRSLDDGRPVDFEHRADNIQQQHNSVNLPFASSQPFDGLNALAEASRQVGATQSTGDVLIMDPALEVDDFFNGPEYYTTRTSNVFSDNNAGLMQSDFTRSTDLSSIAADASDMMMPADTVVGVGTDQMSMYNTLNQYVMNTSQTGICPPSSLTWDTAPQPLIQESLIEAKTGNESVTQHESAERRAASFPRHIAIQPNTSQDATDVLTDLDSANGSSQKPKVRGRFEPERRKEVQVVRRVGACIRCRILKKACSGSTPCSTCNSREGPRLWKDPCRRARLADEFTLYTAGLYSVLAHRDANRAKSHVKAEKSPGDLEISHFDNFEIKMTFAALQFHDAGNGQSNGYAEPRHVVLIDRDIDELPKKLESYLKLAAPLLFENEPSHLMKETLKLAVDLSTTKQDLLLARTLELWTATRVLSDRHLDCKVFATVRTAAATTSRAPINDSTSPYSYALICGQLKAGVEKRAGHLSKTIMTELERRFIKRQQDNQFETVLIAIILLNCVERICWLFQTWGSEHNMARWPLESHPNTYISQGEVVANILHMLLGVRNLIPKTVSQADGVLKTADDPTATKWFEAIGVTRPYLDSCLNAVFDASDSRSLDGKFFARVFFPRTLT